MSEGAGGVTGAESGWGVSSPVSAACWARSPCALNLLIKRRNEPCRFAISPRKTGLRRPGNATATAIVSL